MSYRPKNKNPQHPPSPESTKQLSEFDPFDRNNSIFLAYKNKLGKARKAKNPTPYGFFPLTVENGISQKSTSSLEDNKQTNVEHLDSAKYQQKMTVQIAQLFTIQDTIFNELFSLRKIHLDLQQALLTLRKEISSLKLKQSNELEKLSQENIDLKTKLFKLMTNSQNLESEPSLKLKPHENEATTTSSSPPTIFQPAIPPKPLLKDNDNSRISIGFKPKITPVLDKTNITY